MLVSELKGPLLSYWVAKAEGMDVRIEHHMLNPRIAVAVWPVKGRDPKTNGLLFDFLSGPYHPHENWLLAGPLLDKYKLDLQYLRKGTPWKAIAYCGRPIEYGDTPLEAICRAVVAAKFRPEVQA